MTNTLKGTGVALVTPFLNNKIDYIALERIINHTINGKVEYLVSLGTTGETPTLSPSDQLKVLDFTIEKVGGRVPVVAGFGGNNTAEIVNSIKEYHFEGVAAILSSSPNYNKPTQEGIFQHYMAIAEAAPRPIIIYNVPGRTARNITADTTLRLAKASDKFIAIKEASGDMVQCMEIAKNRPDNFLLISGDDVLTLPMLSYGADGVISVIANAYPKPFAEMVRLGLTGDFKAARLLHFALQNLMNLIFVDGNPAGVKGALDILNISNTEVRLPLVKVTDKVYQQIKKETQLLQAEGLI